MKKKEIIKPTETEMEILRVLWDSGPSTVRLVHEKLNESRQEKVGYTTTLKLMQIMHQKRLLKRDEESRSHIYTPLAKEKATQKAMLNKFVDTVFGGSALKLVMQALGNKKASSEEIQQIKDYINQLEEDKK